MRDCLVDVDIHSDADCKFIKQKKVISKREMKCCECRKTITPGTPFLLETGRIGIRSGPEYRHYVTCLPCLELRERFCCRWYFGQVLDDIREALCEQDGELNLGCLDGLCPEAIERMERILEAVSSEFDDLDDDPDN